MEVRLILKPGDTLGDYRMVRKIGQGGMGEVWEAWDDKLGRQVALKVLAPDAIDKPEMLDRFRGEGRALARLKHQNVVTLYAIGEQQGTAYMALEFVDGLPLDHYLMSHPCGLHDTLKLFRQMLEGLAAAHEAGIIHRDLKPSNIVVDSDLKAKLVDFGIAKVYSDHQTSHTEQDIVIGTTNYLSPECAAGRMATPQSDIYAMGLVLYHMLTGETPFSGRNNLETIEKIRSSSLAFSPRLQPLLPEGVKQIVARMTAKAPSHRFATAREAIAELDRISLAELPADLREPCDHRLPVSNFSEVRKKCEAHGYDTAEMRFIINLAARLQQEVQEHIDDDRTVRTGYPHMLRISDSTVQDAVRRYQAAKSTLSNRRIAVEMPRSPRPRSRQESSGGLGILMSVLAIVATAYYARNLQMNMSSVPVPPSRVPTAVMPLEGVALERARVGDILKLRYKVMDASRTPLSDRTIEWRLNSVEGDEGHWVGDNGARGKWSVSPFRPCKISAVERVNAEAAGFHSVRLQCESPEFKRDVFYYSNKARWWVWRETEWIENGQTRIGTTELLGYSHTP